MDKKRNLNIIAENDWLTGYATASNSGIVFDDVECFRWRFFFNVNYAYGGFVFVCNGTWQEFSNNFGFGA